MEKDLQNLLNSFEKEKLSSVLNKACTIPSVLKRPELLEWIKIELTGYYETSVAFRRAPKDVPHYRKVVGFFADEIGRKLDSYYPDLEDFNFNYLRESVSELEDISESKSEFIRKPDKLARQNFNVPITQFVFPKNQVLGIIQNIKTEFLTKLTENTKQDQNGSLASILPLAIHNLHPMLERFKDQVELGNYKMVILDSLIELERQVKIKSGVMDKSGTTLMQTVFSAKSPLLKTSEDEGIRLGYMNLFSGVMLAVRNRIAHQPVTFESSDEASEIISFISHLFRILDYADKVNSPTFPN